MYDSSDNPTFKLPVVDSRTYDELARQITNSGKLTYEIFWQSPFYPLFLASVYKVIKESTLVVKIVQMVFGVCTSILVYLLGTKILNNRIGILAGIIASVYLPLVFFEGELLATGIATFFAVALVFTFLVAAEKKQSKNYLVLGILGGLSIITRPVFLPFFIAGSCWLVHLGIKQSGVQKILPKVMILVAGLLVIIIPIGLLGYHTTGKFRIMPIAGGINMYIGNNPDYEEQTAIRPGYAWRRLINLPEKYGITNIYESEKFFRNRAIKYALDEPLSFVKGLSNKTAQFISSREIPRNIDIYSFRKWSWLLRLGTWKFNEFGFPFGLLLSLSFVGAMYWWRKIPAPLWLFLGFYSASIILIFVSSRYRMPIVPTMCVLAAGGCAALLEVLKKKQWAKLTIFALSLLLVGFVSSASGPFREEKIDYNAELNFFLGVALEEQGQVERAKKAYFKAIEMKSDFADAYYNLGVMVADQGKLEDAIGYYNLATKADPNYSHAYYNLGVLFQSQGKHDEAIKYFLENIRIDPYDALAHNNLGNLLKIKSNPPEAIKHYLLAVQNKPNYAAAHHNLGYALFRQGSLEEAAHHFQMAINLEPTWPTALSGLVRILATHPNLEKRDPDRAIALAEHAAKLTKYQEPRILSVLAMAYAAAGQFERAETAASKALDLILITKNDDLTNQIRKQQELYRKKQLK